MNILLIFYLSAITVNVSLANDYFFRRFPECKVFEESDCSERFEFVGSRMACYKSFLQRAENCRRNTRSYFNEAEESLKAYEQKKFLTIKEQASATIEDSYRQRSTTKIDDFHLRNADKLDGAIQVRGILSYINRVIVPSVEKYSKRYDVVYKNAKDAQSTDLISRALVDCSSLLAEVEILVENFQAYRDEHLKQVSSLQFQENRQAFSEIIRKTEFLISDAYQLKSALISIKAELLNRSRKTDLAAKFSRSVTKGEIVLRKLRQLRSDPGTSQAEIDFYRKLCELEYADRQFVCETREELP